MEYNIRAATPRDAYTIVPLLREADKREIDASHGTDHEAALYNSIAESDEAFFVSRPDGFPLAVFGVGNTPQSPHIGHPWMIGTDEMLKYRKALVRDARKWVDAKLDTYIILSNYVDSRNAAHINWLKRMGFTVNTDAIISFNSVPFYCFYRSK